MRYYLARVIGILVFIYLLMNKEKFFGGTEVLIEMSKYHLAWLLPLGIAFLVIWIFDTIFYAIFSSKMRRMRKKRKIRRKN